MAKNPDAGPGIPQLRLLAIAIVIGAVFFAIVVGAMQWLDEDGGGFGSEPIPVLDTLGIVVAAACVPLAFVIRNMLWSRGRGDRDPIGLETYGRGVLVYLALLEGPALLNLVVWLVNGDPIPPAIVAAVLVALMVSGFPSQRQLDEL